MMRSYIWILSELIISLVITLTNLLIHYRQHFRFQCCNKHYRKPKLISKLIGKFSAQQNDHDNVLSPKLRVEGYLFSLETLRNPEVGLN